MKLQETLQSRKFWMTIILIVAAVAMLLAGQIEADKAIEIIRWAASVYVGALSVEDAAKKVVEKWQSQ